MRAKSMNRSFRCAALAASIAVAGSVIPSALSAQATVDTSATGSMAQTTRADINDNDDDDTNWGWLGLLGLAGLLGLRKRDEHVHHTDTTTRRP